MLPTTHPDFLSLLENSASMLNIGSFLRQAVSLAPLVTFRVLYGLLGAFGLSWSAVKGEIAGRYWAADFHFKYFGFEWVPYVGDAGIVVIYVLGIVAALAVAAGAFYRWSVLLFSLSFSYLHTVDASNFINHYYLIWIFSVYLFFLPAQRQCSLDLLWKRVTPLEKVPRWMILLLQVQVGIVYVCAGIAKLNYDWLYRAMPLKIWLLQHKDFPLLGNLFEQNWVHYGMSWLAAFYDLTIVFWLSWKRTRMGAYIAVIIFHVLTGLLFNIGLFPPLMILSTLIFFSPGWHEQRWKRWWEQDSTPKVVKSPKVIVLFLSLFLLIQLFLPFRGILFTTANASWTQEYYRYAWKVMLVENEGYALFTVHDSASGRTWEVDNAEFLTGYQIKRMSVQPEHLRQFAHFLADHYAKKYDLAEPEVRVKAHVALNGRLSRLLVDPQVDLARERAGLGPRSWIREAP